MTAWEDGVEAVMRSRRVGSGKFEAIVGLAQGGRKMAA